MAVSQAHSRAGSDTSSSGSSYQLILDHVLSYPGSYEIPLRTMYALNCAPRAQPIFARTGTPSSSADSSPVTPQCGWYDNNATQSFTESLMAQIQQLPNQPTSLPPSFITSFVRRCFRSELVLVDFPQALTGLDYLKDLETRRRREVAAAMSRLDINRSTLDADAPSLFEHYPGVAQWLKSIEDMERKVEALYTQIYVALRRWILINELSLLPFNKHNCVAMLNTLYPPVVSTPPTSKLTPPVLKAQRDGFFKYIQGVEKSGPRILSTLMQQGKAQHDDNGWTAVTRTLGMYLQVANSMINECADITELQDVSPTKNRDSGRSARSKVDSGISFNGSERRPSTISSNQSESFSPVETSRPKTPSGGRSGTALEKLARGLKTIGRSRTDATEMVRQEDISPPPPEKTKTLRKLRSMGALNERNGSKASLSSLHGSESQAFDVDQMRQQRMKYEATVVGQQKFGARQSEEI